MQLFDMRVLAHYRGELTLQRRELAYNVACRDSHSGGLEIFLLSSSNVQTTNVETQGRAMLAAIGNINCHQRDRTGPGRTCNLR